MIISFANQKGGTSKTTTAENLASIASAVKGRKGLVLDLDPQATLSKSLYPDYLSLAPNETILNTFINKTDLNILPSKVPNLDIVCSHISLWGMINSLSDAHLIRTFLGKIAHLYQYVIIDLPGGMDNIITKNGLIASEQVVIVTSVGKYETELLDYTYDFINNIKERFNPPLIINGILLTKTEFRKNIDNVTSKTVRTIRSSPAYGTLLYDITIPRNVAVQNAREADMILPEFDAQSSAFKEYKKLSEIIFG